MRKKSSGNEYSVLAETLRETRLKAKVTQVELAGRLGWTQSFVSKCDRGAVRLDMVQVRRVCTALGFDFVRFVRAFEQKLARKCQKQ